MDRHLGPAVVPTLEANYIELSVGFSKQAGEEFLFILKKKEMVINDGQERNCKKNIDNFMCYHPFFSLCTSYSHNKSGPYRRFEYFFSQCFFDNYNFYGCITDLSNL